MRTSENSPINLLTGASVDSSATADTSDTGGCCGGGGCMCSPGGAVVTADPDAALAASYAATGLTNASEAPRTTAAPRTSGITGMPKNLASEELLVTGMTCGHCVASVKEEVGALAGVTAVEVVLKKGGESRVTVTTNGPIDRDALSAAIDEAGYHLV